MKTLINLFGISLTVVLFSTLHAQSSGTLWIKTFEPGSSDLTDPHIDQIVLNKLDKLMENPNIEVTFLGAADSIGWVMNGKRVHDKISEAWNDAKRLSRARVLKERYGRGNIGVTHESIAGVKVIWTTKSTDYTTDIDHLNNEIAKLKDEIKNLEPIYVDNGANGKNGDNGHSTEFEDDSNFNWGLKAGFWTWQGGSSGSLLSPSVALNIIMEKMAFVIKGGVTPWHISSPYGNQSESFVYAGLEHLTTDVVGLTVGVFRGWEFITATDDWSFRTTGIVAGISLKYRALEFNPGLTYSNVNTLVDDSSWGLGANLGFNLNINEVFKKR